MRRSHSASPASFSARSNARATPRLASSRPSMARARPAWAASGSFSATRVSSWTCRPAFRSSSSWTRLSRSSRPERSPEPWSSSSMWPFKRSIVLRRGWTERTWSVPLPASIRPVSVTTVPGSGGAALRPKATLRSVPSSLTKMAPSSVISETTPLRWTTRARSLRCAEVTRTLRAVPSTLTIATRSPTTISPAPSSSPPRPRTAVSPVTVTVTSPSLVRTVSTPESLATTSPNTALLAPASWAGGAAAALIVPASSSAVSISSITGSVRRFTVLLLRA